MAETDAQTLVQSGAAVPLPPQGEPCEGCGSPLASDQRYCLECGQRRGGPRVDYRHYMAASGESSASGPTSDPTAPAAVAAEAPEKPQRDYAPLAAVGGIAVLGLMLLVGVLIGKGNDSGTASTPPVIKVPAATAGVEGEAQVKSSKGAGGEGLGLQSGAKKAKKGGGGGTGKAHKASTSELEEHANSAGESYEKESENLPNEIATPGAPPPIDKSKPPGGGEGGAEVIK